MSENEHSPGAGGQDAAPAPTEHLNIKVTDNNNEVFFKIKKSTKLEKLMNAFCERQGKQPSTVRFLFDGTRVRPDDSPDSVCSLVSRDPTIGQRALDCHSPRWTGQRDLLLLSSS